MNYPNLIKEDLSRNLFEYDGGDLWIRENVHFQSELNHCWDKNILKIIEKSKSISEFLWKINYIIPHKDQIGASPLINHPRGQEKKQNYKIRENNKFYCEIIKYSKNELYLVDDILLYDPKIIVKFINKLIGIKKINFSMNLMMPIDDLLEEDDDWISLYLDNLAWEPYNFHPAKPDDLEDIKYIKDNIDKNITFDFSIDEYGIKILKNNKILPV